MWKKKCLICCAITLWLLSQTTLAASAACDAHALLARVRAQSGGEHWNSVGALHADGTASIAGLAGSATLDEDLRTGRYARRFDVAVIARSADVFDGTTLWKLDISGGVHPLNTEFPRMLAVTDGYLARRGYLQPTSDAIVTCAGSVREAGRVLRLLRVTPHNGIPAELGIDQTTATVVRVAERYPITTQITRYDRYQRVHGVLLPFTIASASLLEPKEGFTLNVTRYTVRDSAPPHAFDQPTELHPAIMRNGGTSTTVPMTFDAQEMLVWASINGHPALPFILDTGGHAILTVNAAKMLGVPLRGAGNSGGAGPSAVATQYTHVRSIRIGDAEIDDQPMVVIPYGYSFYERGDQTPIAGIIGLEFFERFATQLDYGNRRVTFTPLTRFVYHGGGTVVPFRFQDDMPMLTAAVDGINGMFGTDTGNSGSLILFRSFLASSGLARRYTAGEALQGHGTGGVSTGTRAVLGAFAIGGHELHKIPTFLSTMTSGAFSSWTEAGNLGYTVLSQFTPTYDYRRGLLYLDPNPHAQPFPVNHSGLGTSKNEPDAIDVDLVSPGSAAASAGIVSGDRIVAVNGKSVRTISRADLLLMLQRPPGTRMTLGINHKGVVRTVDLVLRG